MAAFFSDGPASSEAYTRIRDSEFHQDLRDHLERLWSAFESYCPDAHFLVDARNHFFQRTWEMYVGAVLIQHSLPLRRPPPTGPDLCWETIPTTWIECVAPEQGKGADAVLARDRRGRTIEFATGNRGFIGHGPGDESLILRITSALAEKARKRARYLELGLLQPDHPYVVALSLGGIEDADLCKPGDVPIVAKALLGIGDAFVSLPLDSDTKGGAGHLERPAIAKRSGALVSATGFLNGSLPGVSGVLFTELSVLNLSKRLGTDLVFLHNPTASAPVPTRRLGFGTEWFVHDGLLHRDGE